MKRKQGVVEQGLGGVGPPARRRTFQSLRVRNFRLFILGQIVSATGTWMQSVAAPFLVLQLTHSGVALGIDAGLQFLPILLFGAWGGVIADRFDNRRLLIATQIAFAVPGRAVAAGGDPRRAGVDGLQPLVPLRYRPRG